MWGQCGAGCLWTGDKRREEGEKQLYVQGEALSERRKDTVCVCIPTTKITRDLFEFACPLLEVITDLY